MRQPESLYQTSLRVVCGYGHSLSGDGYFAKAARDCRQKPGPESFLLVLEPKANIDEICGELEKVIPQRGGASEKTRAQTKSRKHRKEVLRVYLLTGITTVTLAALKLHHWHAILGGIFTLFATHHVWERRKEL